MLDKSFYLEKNLEKLSDTNSKVYFTEKNKIENLNDYSRYRTLVFNVLGVFTLSTQMLEITIQGFLTIHDQINSQGIEIEQEIKRNFFKYLDETVKENVTVEKSNSNLNRLLTELKSNCLIDEDLYIELDQYREIRNELIHASLIVNPFMFYKTANMIQYILLVIYHTLRIAQYIDHFKLLFTSK